jgi:hypothetical protein
MNVWKIGVDPLSLALPIFDESFLLTQGFLLKTKKYIHRYTVIGVYRFYENGSTETFRKESKKCAVCYR